MNPTEREAKLNRLISKSASQYDAFTDKQTLFAIKELRRTENSLIAKLADATGDDGIVKRERMNSLLSDVRNMRREITADLTGAMDLTLQQSAGKAFEDLGMAFEGAKLGSLASMGVEYNRLNEFVFKYTAQRFGDDGLVLSDRIWNLSGSMTADLNDTVRTAIIQGQGLNSAVAAVRKVYDAGTSSIRRLVVTESNNAYRAAFLHTAQESRLVNWVRIHKGEADRPNHKCSIYAMEDNYGEGAGIFKASDTKIAHPHPNCTSWLEYIVDRDMTQNRYREQEVLPTNPPVDAIAESQTEVDAALRTLEPVKTAAGVEKWMNKNLPMNYVDLKDFDPEAAKDFARQIFVLQQRYPEGMERLQGFSTAQNFYKKGREYEIARNVDANMQKHPGRWTREYLEANLRKRIPLKKVPSNTNAFATNWGNGFDGVYINKNLAKDYGEFKRRKLDAGNSKWSAVGSPTGTLTHEYGHMLDYWLQANHAPLRADMIDDLWAVGKVRDKQWWRDNVSEYGGTNDMEMFAEMFSDYIHNGDSAKDMSKKFGKRLDDAMNKIRGGGGT